MPAQQTTGGRNIVVIWRLVVANSVAAGALAVSFCAYAAAADVMGHPSPASITIYSWSALHVGGRVGRLTSSETVPAPCGLAATADPSGVFGGLQAGYKYQIAPTWLIGSEAAAVMCRAARCSSPRAALQATPRIRFLGRRSTSGAAAGAVAPAPSLGLRRHGRARRSTPSSSSATIISDFHSQSRSTRKSASSGSARTLILRPQSCSLIGELGAHAEGKGPAIQPALSIL
jgi:hypothetical protein